MEDRVQKPDEVVRVPGAALSRAFGELGAEISVEDAALLADLLLRLVSSHVIVEASASDEDAKPRCRHEDAA